MIYRCSSCGKVFLHPAKKTELKNITTDTTYSTSAIVTFPQTVTIERHICPYCESLELAEYAEPIASVKSVDIADVDALLKDGYVIHELYAKTATLVKKEAKKQ